jgi:hypothetical protein
MFKPNVITSTSSYRLIISEKRNKGITNLVRILHGLERYPVVAHGAVPDHPFAPHLDQQSSVQVVCFEEKVLFPAWCRSFDGHCGRFDVLQLQGNVSVELRRLCSNVTSLFHWNRRKSQLVKLNFSGRNSYEDTFPTDRILPVRLKFVRQKKCGLVESNFNRRWGRFVFAGWFRMSAEEFRYLTWAHRSGLGLEPQCKCDKLH